MNKLVFLFDLDGTLVDSSQGILNSLSAAFEVYGLKPAQPLTSELIGPHLSDILHRLCPGLEERELAQVTEAFKAHYDSAGYQQSSPFAGIEQMLHSLASEKLPLYIATNKRMKPTSMIIDRLGWSTLFDLVVSPDSFTPTLSSKAAILSKLLIESGLEAKDCLYIGDRFADYIAAREAGIPFALAEWGFEGDDSGFPPNTMRLQAPDAAQLISSYTHRGRH